MKIFRRTSLMIIVFLFLKSTLAGESTTKKTLNSDEDIYKWFQTYSEVVGLINKKSFQQVDFSKFIQDSLKSAISQIDAHSSFFTQESYKSAIESTSGEFSGIGVSITSKAIDDETLPIIDVIQGGPSEKAGLKAGDKIIEVDEEKLKGLSSDEVITKLKGKVGSKVKVKVIRKKKLVDFFIIRDIIKDQTSICYRFKDQNIFYLSLKIFNEIAAKQMENLLKKANEGICRGIILDLRRNPGGTLESSIEMAGLFLEKNSVVVKTKNKKGKIVEIYKTTQKPILTSNIPIFILIDNFTASASEILAGALHYYSEQKNIHKDLMVFLVGTTTFGKGSVQELIPVKNGCALKITSMLYYLPNDESIQAVGIKPDFLVNPKIAPLEEIKWINEFYGKESALKNHITHKEVEKLEKNKKKSKKDKKKKGFWNRWFGTKDNKNNTNINDESDNKKEAGKSWEERQQEAIAQDIQIQASVNMINLLCIAGKSNKKIANDRKEAIDFLRKNYLTDEITALEKIK
jgi:carboxyl-terminal processing protease